jgi:hypothetical protein
LFPHRGSQRGIHGRTIPVGVGIDNDVSDGSITGQIYTKKGSFPHGETPFNLLLYKGLHKLIYVILGDRLEGNPDIGHFFLT